MVRESEGVKLEEGGASEGGLAGWRVATRWSWIGRKESRGERGREGEEKEAARPSSYLSQFGSTMYI